MDDTFIIDDKRVIELCTELKKLHKAAGSMGCKIEDPFMALSFLALPVIPDIKITDKGLVDVTKSKFINLFV